jgi:hypothetical protein
MREAATLDGNVPFANVIAYVDSTAAAAAAAAAYLLTLIPRITLSSLLDSGDLDTKTNCLTLLNATLVCTLDHHLHQHTTHVVDTLVAAVHDRRRAWKKSEMHCVRNLRSLECVRS